MATTFDFETALKQHQVHLSLKPLEIEMVNLSHS